MRIRNEVIWRSPEEIIEIGFQRSPVVMMNEAHSGLKRCIRTRQIGKRTLPVAHQAGARHLAMEYTNWREEQQALNLIQMLKSLPPKTPLLVWCGNSHLLKEAEGDWIPMGYQFKKHSNIDPFVIDQTPTVKFDFNGFGIRLADQFAGDLHEHGGTAGFLIEEAPELLRDSASENAILLSTQNELE